MAKRIVLKNVVVVSALLSCLAPLSYSQAAQSTTGLRFAQGPADGAQVVNNALLTPTFTRDHPSLSSFSVLEVLKPLERYVLLIPETVDGQLSVQTDGWHYLVKSSRASGKGVAAISVRADGGRTQMISFQYENVADPLVRALDQLATNEKIRAGSYEPRVLQVFGLIGNNPVQVLWLKSGNGADLFYEPLSPNPNLSSKLQFEKLYSKEEFLGVAKGTPPGGRGRRQ